MLMTTQGSRESDDRGVSESIGFLLIFTIIIAGIGLVTLYGYPMISEQQVSADEKIMEKNMIVLQNDFKSLAYKTVPYKETSLKIGSGPLTVYDPSTNPSSNQPELTITYPGYIPPEPSFKSGELRYESVSAQTDIALEDGAVILRPRIMQGSTMLADPRWFYDETTKTMVINLIRIKSGGGAIAREGIGTVQMRLSENEVADPYQEILNPGGSVEITYNPDPRHDYSVAWRNYLTTTLGMTETITNTYTLNNVDKLVVKKFEIVIESL
jgi:hypothetical protein